MTLPLRIEDVAAAVKAESDVDAQQLLQLLDGGASKTKGIGALVDSDQSERADPFASNGYPTTEAAPVLADFVPGVLTIEQTVWTVAAIKQDPRNSAVGMAFVDGLVGILLHSPIADIEAARAEVARVAAVAQECAA